MLAATCISSAVPSDRQYLVVDHHVDCSMRGVGRQLAEVEGLVHDSLAGEGCVAVYEDGHHLGRGTASESAGRLSSHWLAKGGGKKLDFISL